MGGLFLIAYLAQLALWLPLGLIVWRVPGMRRWLAGAFGVSALAMAYEAFMTFVWSPTVVNPIRVDILLVMLIGCVVDFFTGIALVKPAREGVHRFAAASAASLCLLIPALALLGYVALRAESAAVGDRLSQGRLYRFEAGFRDDATQRRFYGELAPKGNPWAGYYLVQGRDDRVRHLIVNDAGRVWAYHAQLYAYPGEGRDAGGEFRGQLQMPNSRMDFALRRQGEAFEVEIGSGEPVQKLVAKRLAPPRFGKAPSAGDAVRFIGVFAGTHENPPGFAWVIQVWLWRAGDEAWGYYLREPFKGGDIGPMLQPHAVKVACRDDCTVVELRSGRGDVVLRRAGEDEWRAKVAGNDGDIELRRGALVDGFDLELAPLDSLEAHRRWLDAVTTGMYRRELAGGR